MFLAKWGATAAVGTVLVLAASPALAASGWTIVTAPPTGVNASFTGVTSTSDSDAWAVGSENAALNGVGAKALIDHWNGTAWSAGGHAGHPGQHGQPGRGQREQHD